MSQTIREVIEVKTKVLKELVEKAKTYDLLM